MGNRANRNSSPATVPGAEKPSAAFALSRSPRPLESGDLRAGEVPVEGSVREGTTYLSARSLSPSSASAIPSKLRPTSRPMVQKLLSRPGRGAL